ncbi:hypothetical protein [Parashewanella curva]|nr:hypothetical protein [Parashewanella curva]
MATPAESTHPFDNAQLENLYYHNIVHGGLYNTHSDFKLGDAHLIIKSVPDSGSFRLAAFVEGFESEPSILDRVLRPSKSSRYDKFQESAYVSLLEKFDCILNNPNVRANAAVFEAFHQQHPSEQCVALCEMINQLPSSISDPIIPTKDELIAAYQQSLRIRGREKTNQAFYCKGMEFQITQRGNRSQVQLISSQLPVESAGSSMEKYLSDWLNDDTNGTAIRLAELEHNRAFEVDSSSAITESDRSGAGLSAYRQFPQQQTVGDTNRAGESLPPQPTRQPEAARNSPAVDPRLFLFLHALHQADEQRDEEQGGEELEDLNLGLTMTLALFMQLQFNNSRTQCPFGHTLCRVVPISYTSPEGHPINNDERSLRDFIHLLISYKDEHPQVAYEILLKIKSEFPEVEYQESGLVEIEEELNTKVVEMQKIPALLQHIDNISCTTYEQLEDGVECSLNYNDFVEEKALDIIEIKMGENDDNWGLIRKETIRNMITTRKRITLPFYHREMTAEDLRAVQLEKHLK